MAGPRREADSGSGLSRILHPLHSAPLRSAPRSTGCAERQPRGGTLPSTAVNAPVKDDRLKQIYKANRAEWKITLCRKYPYIMPSDVNKIINLPIHSWLRLAPRLPGK